MTFGKSVSIENGVLIRKGSCLTGRPALAALAIPVREITSVKRGHMGALLVVVGGKAHNFTSFSPSTDRALEGALIAELGKVR